MSEKTHADLVIVNHNTLGSLKFCLDSIRDHTSYPYEVIVVDNASTDGSREYLMDQSYVRSVLLETNLGYAAGANSGIREGNGEYIFVMNADVIVTPGWLEPLVDCLASDPQIAVVGPKLRTPDGRIAGAGMVKTEKERCHPRGFLQPDLPGLYEKPEQCVSVSGACYGIKRSLIPIIGLFDESYFMYFEETDYSMRVQSLGYKVFYCPKSRIYHDMKWERRDHSALRKLFERSKATFDRKWTSG